MMGTRYARPAGQARGQLVLSPVRNTGSTGPSPRAHLRQRIFARPQRAGCCRWIALVSAFTSAALVAAQDDSLLALKRLSLDELSQIEVTTVSRRPQRLTDVASAVQVVTGEDIRRSGAVVLPEALRLAPNLHVAPVNSYGWIVSSRGFASIFANKLLVMVDGRSIYTPLFAGVSWDAQPLLLEDIEHIEVVSGPGGTMWGVNAVNGVINILTRHTRDTQGLYVTASAGTGLSKAGAVRYGGSKGSDLHYRVYAKRQEFDASDLPGGGEAPDSWHRGTGGFRIDWQSAGAGELTVQGDVYSGTQYTVPARSRLRGHNLMARWSRETESGGDLRLQVYYDHTWRDDSPSTLIDELDTWDADFQHRFPLSETNDLIWGAGMRLMNSEVRNRTRFVGFVPSKRDMELFHAFVQDEIAWEHFKLTIGTKLEHNAFSGFEVQPALRAAATVSERQTLWMAVSRAVRAPSRIDVDYHLPVPPVTPGMPNVDGGPDFGSESVLSFEYGWRVQANRNLSFSLASYYSRYRDLYSVEQLPGTQTLQIRNGNEGESWGAELSASWQPASRWRLRGGYTWFDKRLRNKPGRTSPLAVLGNDPEHQALIQSMLDLGGGWELDVTARYMSALPDPAVPARLAADVRVAWTRNNWEVAVVGRDLGESHPTGYGVEIAPSCHAKITWRY